MMDVTADVEVLEDNISLLNDYKSIDNDRLIDSIFTPRLGLPSDHFDTKDIDRSGFELPAINLITSGTTSINIDNIPITSIKFNKKILYLYYNNNDNNNIETVKDENKRRKVMIPTNDLLLISFKIINSNHFNDLLFYLNNFNFINHNDLICRLSIINNHFSLHNIALIVNLNQIKSNLSDSTVNLLNRLYYCSNNDTSDDNIIINNSNFHISHQFNTFLSNFTINNLNYSNSFTFDKNLIKNSLNINLFNFQLNSIQWLYNKENFISNDNNKLSINSNFIDYINFANKFFNNSHFININNLFLWNRINNDCISFKKLFDISTNMNTHNNDINTIGLLADEMGLGKTIEILSLILLNKKKFDNPTLIICPNPLLKQWIVEIEKNINFNFTNLKIFNYKGYKYLNDNNTDKDISTFLKKFDVIITTYSVIKNELHYVNYANNKRSFRNPIKYDYSSPLTLLKFKRIIVDEVQMLKSNITNVTKCITMLNSQHKWAISGTPVSKISDFLPLFTFFNINPILDFLNLKPLFTNNDKKNLINYDLKRIFNIFKNLNLGIRHTKDNIKNQFSIPKQFNYLLPISFHPIEFDNYSNHLNSFLSDSGYSIIGNGNTNLSLIQLNNWLNDLRRICNFSLEDKLDLINLKSTKNSKSNLDDDLTIGNIDDILQNMIITVEKNKISLIKENFYWRIKHSQANIELDKNIKKGIEMLINIINDLKSFQETLSVNQDDESLWDLFHQSYFFLGNAYYMIGSYLIEQVKEEALNNQNDDNTVKVNENKEEDDDDDNNYKKFFTTTELTAIEKNQEKEKFYYDQAEIIRKKLLSTEIDNVGIVIDESKKSIGNKKMDLTIINFDLKDFSSTFSVRSCYNQLSTLFKNLNSQTEQFNNLLTELTDLLYSPIAKIYDELNEDEKAKEYENSLDFQDRIFAILACLEMILVNRDLIITSDEEIKPNIIKNMKKVGDQQLSEQHLSLLSELVLISGIPFKNIFEDLKNSHVVHKFSNSNNSNDSSFEVQLLRFEDVTKLIKKENKKFRDIIKKLNVIYNSKLEYYSHLQKLSDSLVSLIQLEPINQKSILKSIKNDNQVNKNLAKIAMLDSRLKYLNNLDLIQNSIEDNDKKLTCSICIGEIFMGAILKCGHFYCRDCIQSWLKSKHNCPLCKIKTNSSEIYSFKFKDEVIIHNTKIEDLDRNTEGEDHPSTVVTSVEDKNDLLFNQRYKVFKDIDIVNEMKIKDNYGAKLNYIIKLVLFIRLKAEQEKSEDSENVLPQILMYSQNLDFLKLISRILNIHNIKNILSISNVSKVSDSIEKFKKDPEITCLLLNVKSLGAGLNLLNARHIFILDPILNRSEELQAMNRNNRIGQMYETYVWNFMIRNSVEENILRYKCTIEKNKLTNKSNIDDSNKEYEEDLDINDKGHEGIAQEHLWNCFFFKQK